LRGYFFIGGGNLGEKSFEQELLERLTTIEIKLATIQTNQEWHAKVIEVVEQHSITLAETKQRVNNIFYTASALGAVVSFVVQLLWPKGGH